MESLKRIELKQSINVDTVSNDAKPWEGPSPHLKHSGIERDGGLTNIYKSSEDNALFDEVYYCKNGSKVTLKYDSANDFYRVYSNGKEVCQVPPWGVSLKDAVRAQAEDVVATTDGKLLTVRTVNYAAIIEEYDPAIDWRSIRTKTIALDNTCVKSFFVRKIDLTFDNADEIAALYRQSPTQFSVKLFTGDGLIYTRSSSAYWGSSQIFAWYSNGYILASQTGGVVAGEAICLLSDGSSPTITAAQYITARIDWTGGSVVFYGTRITATAANTTIAYSFTPPVGAGAWTINTITNSAIGANTVNYACPGGIMRAGVKSTGSGAAALFWSDGVTVTEWEVGHNTPCEFFGLIDGYTDDLVYIKMHTILYEGAYLSASWDEYAVGKPITEVGEINGNYCPCIMKQDSGDYWIIFKRSDETFGYIILSKTIQYRMQEISNTSVEINTIWAGNIIDTALNSASVGGNAFNGFLVARIGSGDGGGAYDRAAASRINNIYGGSVDTGEKILTGLYVDSDAYNILYFIENKYYGTVSLLTDFFYAGEYRVSVGFYNDIISRPNLTGTLYVEDNRIPIPLGSGYTALTAALVDKIAIRENDYDGYQLANEIQGDYEAFELFGSIYLFDGDQIYILNLSAGVVQSFDRIAKATGLKILAQAPTLVYFLSDFDNSIFSFDGGRAVAKMGRFNAKADIQEGYFNVRNNALVLVTLDSLIWIRDGIVTENDLPYVDFRTFSTELGFIFASEGAATLYHYKLIDIITTTIDGGLFSDVVFARTFDRGALTDTSFDLIVDGGSFDQEGSVVPFEWESAFLGSLDNNRQVAKRFVLRFYSSTSEESTVVVTYQAYNQETKWNETKTFTIGDASNPWDEDGYAFISFIPADARALAQSIGASFQNKLLLLEVFAYVEPVERAVIKNKG